MAPRILVVDHNKAFATMLRDMLETEGGYQVATAPTGSTALALLHRADFDLTIVDMDLDPADMGYRELILSIRQVQPTMRLVLIPLMGEDLPPEVHELDIQGALSKPFFADDLLPSIRDALVKKVSPRLRPPAPWPASRSVEQPATDIQAVLAGLARETNADMILLVSYAADNTRVVAHLGVSDDDRAETLAGFVLVTVSAAQAAAHFLGQPDQPFEHNMFEDGSLRLYAMILPGSLMLVVVTPTSTPLGTIRHNLRRAGRDLAVRALT
jgi:CheY-like chemotaxis protein